RNATINSLKAADENGLRSIAFPAISTGIFGFPLNRCAEIMIKTTVAYLEQGSGIKEVVFCLYGEEALELFKQRLQAATY
ncbi:MAG: macro domain-containing protein, partial [Nitrospinota bacterium]|nr:macro domain-containing protein [Nitrospinota bacterium]